MKKPILSEEVAQEQVQILLDYYDIEADTEELEPAQKKAISSSISKIKRGIMNGIIEITGDNGLKITQMLQNPPGDVSTLEYGRVSGKSRVSMKDGGSEYERCYQLVGSVTGVGAKAIQNLDIRDLKYCEALGVLFLSV